MHLPIELQPRPQHLCSRRQKVQVRRGHHQLQESIIPLRPQASCACHVTAMPHITPACTADTAMQGCSREQIH